MSRSDSKASGRGAHGSASTRGSPDGRESAATDVLRAASLYFVVVFASGFAFGMVRVPLLVPRFGERLAELIEAPCMLAAIGLTAHWLTRRRRLAATQWLGAGAIAAAMVLAADLVVGVALRGASPAEVFLDRDPVTGAVYAALLVVFAIAPWWMRTAARSRDAALRVGRDPGER